MITIDNALLVTVSKGSKVITLCSGTLEKTNAAASGSCIKLNSAPGFLLPPPENLEK